METKYCKCWTHQKMYENHLTQHKVQTGLCQFNRPTTFCEYAIIIQDMREVMEIS